MENNNRLKYYFRGVQISKYQDNWYLDHDIPFPSNTGIITLFSRDELKDSPFIFEKLEPETPMPFEIEADNASRAIAQTKAV